MNNNKQKRVNSPSRDSRASHLVPLLYWKCLTRTIAAGICPLAIAKVCRAPRSSASILPPPLSRWRTRGCAALDPQIRSVSPSAGR
uniref:Uncharacterized protein n=1 Tax=Globodera rostochiensis TaxID=31243 RepID=A0A914IAF9_GLORO